MKLLKVLFNYHFIILMSQIFKNVCNDFHFYLFNAKKERGDQVFDLYSVILPPVEEPFSKS